LSYLSWDVTLRTRQPRSAIEEVFLFVIDEMELEIEQLATDVAETIPPPLAKSDADPTPPSAPAAPRPPQGETHETIIADTIRVPAARLDELMDRVGQLVIAQSRLKEIAAASNDAAMKSVTEDIERLSLELRDTTMGVRMLPIGQLFGRFRRLIHDLARDHGKNIDLVTVGEETELDKTVIERLNDPLIHLIRNAVDHGIEDPATRAASGKVPLGRITLAARHIGSG